ncbi:MAG: hypothetical protein HQ539_01770 [Parcubacteria group bacterium]|nr:hypothetical protein [Parcubacteria group bacterium]
MTFSCPTQEFASTDFETIRLNISPKFIKKEEVFLSDLSDEDIICLKKAKDDFAKGKILSSEEIDALLAT